jgi:transposase
MESATFIGVDVCQRSLDIGSCGNREVLKIPNTAASIRRWLAALPPATHIAVESTAKLHLPLVHAALAAGHRIYVLNPRDLAHYAQALGRRAKTDRLDALLIARYLEREHKELHAYQPPSALQIQLNELIQRRHKLVVARQAQRQSFADMSCKLRSATRLVRAYDAAIAEIDERLQQLAAEDDTLRSASKRLRTIVGFGPLLAVSMAHAITRLPFSNADAFIAYSGLDPRPRDSGKLHGRRYLSKRGPAELRRLLYTAAMSASNSKLWRPIYLRLLGRGFATTQALVVIARKLARIAFAILKRDTDFRPELLKVPCAQP